LPDDTPNQNHVDPLNEVPDTGFNLRGAIGTPTPVFRPPTSTPLAEDDPEPPIPPAALWAMKYRRHLHFALNSRDEERLRTCLGDEDGAIYVIDDGAKHNMVSRLVGIDEQGSTYCLVGRITSEVYDRYANAESPLEDVFSEARDLTLCSVFAAPEAVSNVLVADSYATVDDVPRAYLPPNPFLEFTDDPSGDM